MSAISDNRVKNISINANHSIVSALRQMDSIFKKMLLVFKDTDFLGVLSIGDIQRGILKNVSLNDQIESIMRTNITFVSESEGLDKVKEIMLRDRIAPGAVLAGNVMVGENSFIGANSVVKQGVTIGNGVTVGAESVVIKNIPDNEIWVGNPAKKLKQMSRVIIIAEAGVNHSNAWRLFQHFFDMVEEAKCDLS